MSMFKFLNCSIDLTFSKLTSDWFVDDLKFYQLFYKFFIQNLLEILWHNDHRSSAIDSD